MSSPSTTTIRDVRAIDRPAGFLSLAPATSSGYPVVPKPAAAEATAPVEAKRRSSSVSSNGTGFRFLKLGPVHFGGHPDEDQEDWA